MFSLSSRACRNVLAGSAAAAVLLLAHAACTAGAHVSGNGSTVMVPNSRHTGAPGRRCDPPPCPRRAVTVSPKGPAQP